MLLRRRKSIVPSQEELACRSGAVISRRAEPGSGMRTHYAVLSVSEWASPAQIRNAYLSLMRQVHPDCCATTSEQGILACEVNEAYSVLRHWHSRSRYDWQLAQSRFTRADLVRLPPLPKARHRRVDRLFLLAALVFASLLGQSALQRSTVSATALVRVAGETPSHDTDVGVAP